MEIELKHLSTYLPYGLKCKITNSPLKDEIHGLTGIIYDGCCNLGNGGRFGFIQRSYREFLPILRPLTDITKEIDVEGKKITPLLEICAEVFGYGIDMHNENQCHLIPGEGDTTKYFFEIQVLKGNSKIPSFWFNEYQNGTGQEHITSTHEFSYDNFIMLVSWHFDVFGLIERGFAIDVNTLEPTRSR